VSEHPAEIKMTRAGLFALCERLRRRVKEEADREIENADHRLRGNPNRFDEGTKKGAYWVSKHIAEFDLADWLATALKDQTYADHSPGQPLPLILTCPVCGVRHIDRGEFSTKPHHTHACQACGICWRPALVPTVGVQHLPGFKDEDR